MKTGDLPERAVSDTKLIEGIRQDGVWAKSEFYKRFAPMVTGFVHRVLGGRDVDDTVQDVFVVAFSKIHTLRDSTRAAAWLRGIALNHARRTIRRRALRRRLGFFGDPLDVESIVGIGGEPEARAELEILYGALESFPADVRIALVLHRVEGFTLTEIVEATRTSLSTVKRRLRRGHELLEKHKGARR